MAYVAEGKLTKSVTH